MERTLGNERAWVGIIQGLALLKSISNDVLKRGHLLR